MLGLEDGDPVGSEKGIFAGAELSPMLGFLVLRLDGSLLGDTVGDEIGDKLGSEVDSKLGR